MSDRPGAVFLDRDGTIIHDPGYLHDPEQVVLLKGAAAGLRVLSQRGWPMVIVSNQSGIARGIYGADGFRDTMRALEALLPGVSFLGTYFCAHHPDFTGPCECRKPGVKLFREAAAAHHLDLGASWFVGDRWRDVQPAMTLGGRGVLVNSDPLCEDATVAARSNVKVVPDLMGAAAVIGSPRA